MASHPHNLLICHNTYTSLINYWLWHWLWPRGTQTSIIVPSSAMQVMINQSPSSNDNYYHEWWVPAWYGCIVTAEEDTRHEGRELVADNALWYHGIKVQWYVIAWGGCISMLYVGKSPFLNTFLQWEWEVHVGGDVEIKVPLFSFTCSFFTYFFNFIFICFYF